MPSVTDKSFKYVNAEKSRKPGYLKARMQKYRAQVQQQAEQPTNVVTPGAWLVKRGQG